MITFQEIQTRLREEIRASGMTQKELAKRLGISQSAVGKYMRRDRFPAIDTFANLCRVLDVSADEILGLRE